MNDEPSNISSIPPIGDVTDKILLFAMPSEKRCAWCDFNAGVKPKEYFSHGICPAHQATMLVSIGKGGSIEALLAAVLAALAERSAAR